MIRWVWFGLGWFLIALGVIGALLPVMPTTVFLIGAAGCFTKSSPRFERWLLDHRWLGPPVRNWRERGAIPIKAKILAIGSMAGGYAIFLLAVHPWPWLALLVGGAILASALFVGSRPGR
ncbi:hypothetical protein SAMN05444678_11080 [Sphingomonas sp. YR710]|uniref:YbaN family protein n=1 Tax=Sphingomonas sp. YR710 TaxID=1882773 RepID=UPI00088F45FB|nr:YbaN family protein [Sphingomonas sp. YR710]SDD20331.1 hypothetical protein SAMN05444678_11080 [Sphingomonas sp. YR710]